MELSDHLGELTGDWGDFTEQTHAAIALVYGKRSTRAVYDGAYVTVGGRGDAGQ